MNSNNFTHPILLFGISPVTIEIAKSLQQKQYELLVIDDTDDQVEILEKHHLPFQEADFRDDDVLQELGIGCGTSLIFSLFSEDYENVFLVLSARNLDPTLKIASITHSHDAIHKLKAAGANTIIDPYQMSGKKLFEILKAPDVSEVFDAFLFQNDRLVIREIQVEKGSRIDGMMLEELHLDETYHLLILGIHDKELHRDFIFVTEGLRHKVDYGDILVVIGEKNEVARFQNDYGNA